MDGSQVGRGDAVPAGRHEQVVISGGIRGLGVGGAARHEVQRGDRGAGEGRAGLGGDLAGDGIRTRRRAGRISAVVVLSSCPVAVTWTVCVPTGTPGRLNCPVAPVVTGPTPPMV